MLTTGEVLYLKGALGTPGCMLVTNMLISGMLITPVDDLPTTRPHIIDSSVDR